MCYLQLPSQSPQNHEQLTQSQTTSTNLRTAMDAAPPPEHFLCPISGELMKDPVTIFTGVTYERKNIEKWFFTYNKKTCPATMQTLSHFHITPNHTLKRLIHSWQANKTTALPRDGGASGSLVSELLAAVEASPFKVTALKKLRSLVCADEAARTELARSSDGVGVLVRILAGDPNDFDAFRASEEAVAVLHHLPVVSGDGGATLELLTKPEAIKAMAVMLQRASAETRLHTLAILRGVARSGEYDWSFVVRDRRMGAEFFKSLLELVSDELASKASSAALDVLIEIMARSKKSRLRAIEAAGAVCVLVELLPEATRARSCEKILYLMKLLCECAEGRLALVEHGMGIAAVSKKAVGVSAAATKAAVKVLWLISSFHPTERVLEEMLVCGSVKKLVALLHMDGRSSTKDKVVNICKLHGNSWKRYPCFPSEYKDYLGLVLNDSNP